MKDNGGEYSLEGGIDRLLYTVGVAACKWILE